MKDLSQKDLLSLYYANAITYRRLELLIGKRINHKLSLLLDGVNPKEKNVSNLITLKKLMHDYNIIMENIIGDDYKGDIDFYVHFTDSSLLSIKNYLSTICKGFHVEEQYEGCTLNKHIKYVITGSLLNWDTMIQFILVDIPVYKFINETFDLSIVQNICSYNREGDVFKIRTKYFHDIYTKQMRLTNCGPDDMVNKTITRIFKYIRRGYKVKGTDNPTIKLMGKLFSSLQSNVFFYRYDDRRGRYGDLGGKYIFENADGSSCHNNQFNGIRLPCDKNKCLICVGFVEEYDHIHIVDMDRLVNMAKYNSIETAYKLNYIPEVSIRDSNVIIKLS